MPAKRFRTHSAGGESWDRITFLPQAVVPQLAVHLEEVRLHENDLKNGGSYVRLFGGLEKKYPGANREWG